MRYILISANEFDHTQRGRKRCVCAYQWHAQSFGHWDSASGEATALQRRANEKPLALKTTGRPISNLPISKEQTDHARQMAQRDRHSIVNLDGRIVRNYWKTVGLQSKRLG